MHNNNSNRQAIAIATTTAVVKEPELQQCEAEVCIYIYDKKTDKVVDVHNLYAQFPQTSYENDKYCVNKLMLYSHIQILINYFGYVILFSAYVM